MGIGSEETTDKTMDLSLAGRVGMWASGAVDSWGSRAVPDNTSFDRLRQFSSQTLDNHFLRQIVYASACGAQYFDNFTKPEVFETRITSYNVCYTKLLRTVLVDLVVFLTKRSV